MPAVVAVTAKPSGAALTASPCDIQTVWLGGWPVKSVDSTSLIAASVLPYSRAPVRATVPPRAWAIDWKP